MTTSTPDGTLTAAMCADRPAVLRGAGRDWPVYAALGEARLRELEDRPVVAEDAGGRPVTVALREILDESRAERPRGLYLRDQLVSEFEPTLWNLVPREVRRLNWLLALPGDVRPDWAWLMIGGAGTGSPLHVDTMASSAWNLLGSGRKRWTFHPPGRAEELRLLPPGCGGPPGGDGTDVVTLVQEPGDVVVTPSGWAHEVHNLTGTVSVTANFVNRSNVGFVRRYFEILEDRANLDLLTAVGTTFDRLDGVTGGSGAR
ncbi:transcription factor jumonji [Streptomyces sp. NPDC053741]|uniref:Transcription factor jumonji n=1 Tax=Streptomyces pratensis (strain ATCC 33331 / IAF-45CD) TaxID=591167 RepID=A0A8D4BIU5_STRFA|nr:MULTISPECIES: transcription factor jumonji [Streptomyces]MCX4413597.1 bifunctional arginine demethylase and lysyl-hydroxylase [[Kitasatospora] papulosa]MCY1650415.1 transcription factor jumonji [Streptomyces sp. SL203]MCY1682455.1 transcription factor jumonji [Streptomyces sp. SL294]MDF6061300.1 transcription factor jumonji [Streptomyces sp. JH010]MEE1780246.1 transcription factor jumonji [Streptomyces sp. JV181]